ALAMAAASPQARVWAVDVNRRALELTAGNAQRLGLSNVQVATGEELLGAEPALAVDSLWSNPPIRVGKSVLHELLGVWLPRLAPGGRAHLVVHKNLGSDSLQRWIEQELQLPAERIASSKGYRVLLVHRASASGREAATGRVVQLGKHGEGADELRRAGQFGVPAGHPHPEAAAGGVHLPGLWGAVAEPFP